MHLLSSLTKQSWESSFALFILSIHIPTLTVFSDPACHHFFTASPSIYAEFLIPRQVPPSKLTTSFMDGPLLERTTMWKLSGHKRARYECKWHVMAHNHHPLLHSMLIASQNGVNNFMKLHLDSRVVCGPSINDVGNFSGSKTPPSSMSAVF